MYMNREMFLKPWQVTDKIIEWIFSQFIVNILQVTNSKNNNSQAVINLWMDVMGCVWVGQTFLSHDEWQIKLLSEFFPNSPWTFYEWL